MWPRRGQRAAAGGRQLKHGRQAANGRDNKAASRCSRRGASGPEAGVAGAKLIRGRPHRSSLLLPPAAPIAGRRLLWPLLLLVASNVRPSHLAGAAQVAADGSPVIKVKVGALLEESDHEQANMFIRTIKMINERHDETIRRLLNGSTDRQQQVVHLEPMVEFLGERESSLEADAKVCQLVESGIYALLGPTDGASIQHVQSICDNMEIPYFELRPFMGSPAPLGEQPEGARLPVGGQQPSEQVAAAHELEALTMNLYPPAHLLTSAYIDLIYAWNWSSFAIIYEQPESMINLQDLFKESSGTWTSKWQIKLFQFQASAELQDAARAAPPAEPKPASNGSSQPARGRRKRYTFRDIFWQIKMSGETNVLLDVRTESLYEALKQAQQVGCMTERFSYLITSLDLHTIELEDFKYSRTRITALSMIEVAKQATPDASYLDGARRGVQVTNETSPGPRAPRLAEPRAELESPFDERYLERLGVHVAAGEQVAAGRKPSYPRGGPRTAATKLPKFRLSPSVVLERAGSYMEPAGESGRDWSRRETLLSSPASMGLLPTVDRDNEQRLFEFFVEQQERNLSRVRLSTASAILHDSLLLYMLGLADLGPADTFPAGEGAGSASCSHLAAQLRTWPHGSSLVNFMRRQTFRGLTGHIAFDQRGLRTDFKLDLLGMAPDIGLIKVGEWHSRASLEPGELSRQQQAQLDDSARSYDELSSFYERELRRYTRLLAEGARLAVPYSKPLWRAPLAPAGAVFAPPFRAANLLVNEIIFDRLYREQADQVDTLIVTTKLSQPYFMLKETPNKLEGNDQYEGFAVDLIHELSKLVNFRYRWREVADKKYGSKEVLANGSVVWNGMIGEIVRGQADLAIVDLTITAQREEAVDFTLPFMNTGISILFKKPTTKVTTLFSFLSPFSSDVWAYVLAAYCGISANLFLVGHLSPYEWADPHPCRHSSGDDQETVLRNQFSLLNSFWFTIGSLMQQGSDLTPRSMSTRTIAGIWYFFTLIMISSYTANLAAFLTVEKVVYPIENVRDLSNQQEIRYGCVESGSTCTFFHDSQIDTYKRINETMRRFRTYLRSNDEGQKRVEEGKFAFFMESASIEYIVERNCNLTQIGGLLDSKGYGLATSKKSRLKRPYRTLLSEGILHLQETGMLHILKNRWWKERRGGGTCTDDGKGSGVTELSLANVGGVFVVLLGGLAISFLVAIAEFMWRARRSGSTRDRMCEEMMADLKFALACKRSTKPVSASVRRPRRHLPAALQSSQSLDSHHHRQGRAKDCDPVLLHAMLTMLMQQQQRQTLAQAQTETQGQTLRSQTQQPQQTDCLAGAKLRVKKPQTDYSGLSFERRNLQHLPQGDDLERYGGLVYADHLCQPQQQARWLMPSGADRRPDDSLADNAHRNSDAEKKRFLFAQQPMETADESLAMVVHQH